jgi:hypothetical protein
MGYILKNTSGLVSTRLTDVGRRYLSQGNFNISYFQIGDSEVNYSAITGFNLTLNNILEPSFNAQNDSGSPQSNKENIKYPYYVSGSGGNTYGIPFMDSKLTEVYNYGGIKGFFTTGDTNEIQTSSNYTISPNYWIEISDLNQDGQDIVELYPNFCQASSGTPKVNDLITIVYDGVGDCGSFSTSPILTYRIQSVSPSNGTTATTYTIRVDRTLPNYSGLSGNARVYLYPSGMTELYDYNTPLSYLNSQQENFSQISEGLDTPIWNMNIPWSESVAGVFSSVFEDYTSYGSVNYLGTKEYLGYQTPEGQTDTSEVFYYNSFNEKVVVNPKHQKAIAIIHYTNQDLSNSYGEKFSTTPFDPQNPIDSIGLARNFKITIPTLIWHKSKTNSIGETFWIDPPGYDLCKPYYIKSTKNIDMNDPGIRYFHLWDLNPGENGNLNRIGKVFPDQKIVIIDDEEVIAAMSYKSNRNWTLPSPKLSTITPNICDNTNQSSQVGVLTNTGQTMWVTYRFDSDNGVKSSLHCNYYSHVSSDSSVINNSQNVAVRFGPEFNFMNLGGLSGYSATSMKLICQLVEGGESPSPTEWREIDVTSQITIGGEITIGSLTGTTLQIDSTSYGEAPIYDLSNYISIPMNGSTNELNFGDEYYFYGNLETDISATIYEMRYLINLGRNQFTDTSNPTWVKGTKSYVSELGLYNNNNELLIISKLQSPELRQGIQQYVVKFDF